MPICCQGNVGPAAFWLLAFLLTAPEAMKAVRREFNRLSLNTDTTQAPTLDPRQPTPVFGKTEHSHVFKYTCLNVVCFQSFILMLYILLLMLLGGKWKKTLLFLGEDPVSNREKAAAQSFSFG